MVNLVKDYEVFIKKAVKNPTQELARYHNEMIRHMQHERAIHLAVTLFFVGMTVVMLAISMWLLTMTNDLLVSAPTLGATLIMTVLSIFYVRHYYFLENHIQKLYEYSREIHEGLERKESATFVEKIADTVEKIFDRDE